MENIALYNQLIYTEIHDLRKQDLIVLARKFPPNTAGSKMITAIPRARIGEKIKNIKRVILKKSHEFETIDYVYVVDKKGVLKGIASIREILSADESAEINKIMKKDVATVTPLTHQERVVYVALHKGIKSVPIVDKKNRLLGIVPYDIILQIFNQEVREDIFRFGGIFHKVGKEFFTIKSPAKMMIKARLPSLLIGLLGGILAASIVSGFEAVISKYLILAAFLPAVVYLSDAVGTQSETLTVRALALDPKLRRKPYLLREIKVASFLGIACSGLLVFVTLIGWKNLPSAIVIGISLFIAIIVASLNATLLPFLFKNLNLDPASSSGPFATIVSDVMTIIIYFVIASLLLTLT